MMMMMMIMTMMTMHVRDASHIYVLTQRRLERSEERERDIKRESSCSPIIITTHGEHRRSSMDDHYALSGLASLLRKDFHNFSLYCDSVSPGYWLMTTLRFSRSYTL